MFQKPHNQDTLVMARFLTAEKATPGKIFAGVTDFYFVITEIIAIFLQICSHIISIINMKYINNILEMCLKITKTSRNPAKKPSPVTGESRPSYQNQNIQI